MRNKNKNPITLTVYNSAITYHAPASLTYSWNLGSLALFCLVLQMVTGIFLAMHYVPTPENAFNSIEHIMRDVNYGWLMRYLHANGASMFFLVVYTHLFRGLYFGSYMYPRHLLWCSGVIILLIMILTAFMGYVLPWGQMSFWAATVITNLASAVPAYGDHIVYWLWGGFSVGGPTLNRFFSLHYLLPFVIVGILSGHLILLHEAKSNLPLGCDTADKIPFTPYYSIKDMLGLTIFWILFLTFLFYGPNFLGHTDNYIRANPMVTPTHIVPEWYFLPFYAILRSVPNKLGGVALLIAAILVLLTVPFITNGRLRSAYFFAPQKFFFWIFFIDCLVLGYIGGQSIESPYYEIGQYCTFYYFFYFLGILPFINWLDNYADKNWFSDNVDKTYRKDIAKINSPENRVKSVKRAFNNLPFEYVEDPYDIINWADAKTIQKFRESEAINPTPAFKEVIKWFDNLEKKYGILTEDVLYKIFYEAKLTLLIKDLLTDNNSAYYGNWQIHFIWIKVTDLVYVVNTPEITKRWLKREREEFVLRYTSECLKENPKISKKINVEQKLAALRKVNILLNNYTDADISLMNKVRDKLKSTF